MRWQGEATLTLNTFGCGLNENRNLLVFILFLFSFSFNSDNLFYVLAFIQNLDNDEPKDDAPQESGTETFTQVTPSMQ